jgi:hypothetical protein
MPTLKTVAVLPSTTLAESQIGRDIRALVPKGPPSRSVVIDVDGNGRVPHRADHYDTDNDGAEDTTVIRALTDGVASALPLAVTTTRGLRASAVYADGTGRIHGQHETQHGREARFESLMDEDRDGAADVFISGKTMSDAIRFVRG